MNILTISNSLLVRSQGSGNAILNFSEGLRDIGNQVDLYGPESYEPLQKISRGVQYKKALGMLFFVLIKIIKNTYDVIEFYGAECWLAVLVLKLLPNRNYIIVVHSNGIETHAIDVIRSYSELDKSQINPKRWYHFDQSNLFHKAFKNCDGIVTVSTYDKNYAVKNYKDPSQVQSIKCGLPDILIGCDINNDRGKVIGYCGSWIPRKGIKIIQEDISMILAEYTEYSLKIIGVGQNFLKEEFFSCEISDRIEVIPFIKNKEELIYQYKEISILIVPSIYESFGLVTAEGMACGCAIVANKSGLAANLKHKKEAWIMQRAESPLLYEGVKELIQNEELKIRLLDVVMN